MSLLKTKFLTIIIPELDAIIGFWTVRDACLVGKLIGSVKH